MAARKSSRSRQAATVAARIDIFTAALPGDVGKFLPPQNSFRRSEAAIELYMICLSLTAVLIVNRQHVRDNDLLYVAALCG